MVPRRQASLGRLFLDVEVCGVELSGLLQAIPIFDDHAPALRRSDETVSPQLQGSIHMNGGEPGGVAEFGLRDRHLKGLAVYQADRPETHIDLAEDVRDTG